MDQKFEWAKALDISDQELEQHKLEVKNPGPLIYNLLLQKKIDEERYLRWARNKFGLASLGRSYFINPHDAEVWYAMKIEYHWTPWLVPLRIWDNTLFVGCVELPPAPIKISLPVHFVLCPAAGLERIWKFYMGDMGVEVTMNTKFTVTPVAAIPKIPTDMPAMPISTPNEQSINRPLSIPDNPIAEINLTKAQPVMDSMPTPPVTTATTTPSAANLDQIDFAALVVDSGKTVPKIKEKPLQQITTETELDFSNITLAKAETNTEQAVKPLQSTAPMTPPPVPTTAPIQATATPTPPAAKTPAPPVKPPAPPSFTNPQTLVNFEISNPKISKPVTMPPPVPTSTAIPTPIVKPMPQPMVNSTKPSAPVSNQGQAAPIGNTPVPPSFDMAKNIDEIAAYAFKEMTTHYEKSILALYQNGSLLIHRWSNNVNPNPQHIGTPLTIDRPNIFKIAHDTKKPYHGPTVTNEINKQFFDNWNDGLIPANVTVQPLTDGKNLIGHLIGICSKEFDVYASLELMAKIAEAFQSKSNAIAA